ncbi:uncharacterized protein [Dysidea avara]|uniref:uncharacterized protein n=1 Tax=Dysidea avara TaxID=196820 RepID=UPI0033238D79
MNASHELRAWLLHYSTAVLYGVLPEDYYQHHLLLVEASYLLLQRCITERDIQQSFELLKHYCFLFAALYGERHMTINIHNLLHIPNVVKNMGPLWAHSCFPFESANGELLKLFHRSQAVEKQVIRHISEHHKLPGYAKEVLQPGSQQEILFTAMNHSKRIINHSKKMSLTGKPYQGRFSRDDITCMQKAYGTFDTTSQHNICFYPYLYLQNNCVISAKTKSRTTKRNNSCLSYIDTEGKLQRGICQKLFCFYEAL